MDLFYGCRRLDSDLLFKNKWLEYAKELDGKSMLHAALSRELGVLKVYVQNLVEEHSSIVCEILIEKKGTILFLQDYYRLMRLANVNSGHVYICGDARKAYSFRCLVNRLQYNHFGVSLAIDQRCIAPRWLEPRC
jgi:sulfite reductase alpha subunit-like flavoprotein